MALDIPNIITVSPNIPMVVTAPSNLESERKIIITLEIGPLNPQERSILAPKWLSTTLKSNHNQKLVT